MKGTTIWLTDLQVAAPAPKVKSVEIRVDQGNGR